MSDTRDPRAPYGRPWRRWMVGACLAMVAITLAIGFVYPRQATRGFLINEEYYFATLAEGIASGSGYVTYAIDTYLADEIEEFPAPEFSRPPGHALFYGGLLKFGFSEIGTGIALSIFWLVLTVVTFYLLAEALLGSSRVALLLCGIYLGTSTTLVHGTMVAPEAQFDALILIVFWCLLDPGRWRSALAGVSLYLAVATKILSLAYVPLVPAYLLWVTSSAGNAEAGDGSWAVWRRLRWRPRAAAEVLVPWFVGMLAAWVLVTNVAGLPGNAPTETVSRYSLNFIMETPDFPTVGSPGHYLEQPDAYAYIAEHPLEVAWRFARLVSRTPKVLNEVGALPLRGSLGWLLMAVFALAFTVGWPQQDPRVKSFLWFCLAAFVITLLALWGYLVRVRYLYQLYPLLLIVIAAQGRRLAPAWERFPHTSRRALTWVAVVVLVAYPSAWTLREAYGNPIAFLGRGLAIHVVDYDQLGRDVSGHVEADSVMITDFAYEIPWLVGNPTIFTPYDADDFRWVVDRWEVLGVALRKPVDPQLAAQLHDFMIAVERPGYVLWTRDTVTAGP